MSSSGKIKAPFGTNRSNLRYYLFLKAKQRRWINE